MVDRNREVFLTTQRGRNQVSAAVRRQEVTVADGERVLALIEENGGVEEIIVKCMRYIKGWDPESGEKAELTKARNVRDYMRIVMDLHQRSQTVVVQNLEATMDSDNPDGKSMSQVLDDLPESAIVQIASILRANGKNLGSESKPVEVVDDCAG